MRPLALALPLLAAGFLGAAIAARPVPQKSVKVTFYLSTECPVAAKYTPRIRQIVEDFAVKGVEFESRFPNAADDAAKMAAYLTERELGMTGSLDVGGVQAEADGVRVVPAVVVRDGEGRVLYRGAIDDSRYSDGVKRSYLCDALAAVLKGQTPQPRETESFGCAVQPGPMPPVMEEVSYAGQVAEILNRHCVDCHRPGQVGPFSLIGYENASKWSKMVATVAESRRMPPWPADPNVGEFSHENRLSDAQVETLKRWDAAGAPRGDAANEPPTPTFTSEWGAGEPDIVLEMPEEFSVGADGRDEYWNFVVDPKLKEPVWVSGIDVRPGNTRIVHHVIAFLDDSGQAEKLAASGRAGGYKTFGGVGFVPSGALGGWAPGLRPALLKDGAAMRLEPGTKVILQVHYNKSGKPETDRTKIGLYLAKKPVKERVEIAWLANPAIRIKAGDPAAKFTQTIPIPVDVRLYSLMPHMHYLGRSMKATWVKPDGTEQGLINVPDWSFNWQLQYALKEPLLLPRGSKLRIEATYDNSSANPNNPSDPPRDVRWGEETTDEMMLLVASISVPMLGTRESGLMRGRR
jgi:mono/diheme cytochrome c family protein